MNEDEKYIKWVEINAEDHKAYRRLVASIKRDRKYTSQERKEVLEQLSKARSRSFFEIRMKYLGH